jgi:hypothetical protein
VDQRPGLDELTANWWEYWRRHSGTREERKALSLGEPLTVQEAHDYVEQQVAKGDAAAVDLLVRINDGKPDDEGVTVGCGPLEDLLHEHGDAVVDRVELFARQSPSFAKALSHVWLERGHLSPNREQRLSAWVRAPARDGT